MAISNELKEVYSSNPKEIRHYETVEMSHSLFSKTFYFVLDDSNHDWELEDASVVTFLAFPFQIKLPELGSPQQDISFVFSNVGREAMPELESAAENIEEAIKLTYRVYMDGFATPQTTAINLILTNIVVDNYSVTAVATRPNLYAKKIPTGNQSLFDRRFWGLYV